jgi:hypothetical protein
MHTEQPGLNSTQIYTANEIGTAKLAGLVICIYMIIFQSPALAQKNFFFNKYIDPAGYFGRNLPQNDIIRYLVDTHIYGFQLNAGINTDGSAWWHKYLNYPRLGAGYYHSNLGNKEVFGYVDALYGTAAIKTFRQKNFINIEHNLTAGLGLVGKQYYLHKNSLNTAFGSPVNIFVQYALLIPVRISKNIEIYGGSCFTHVSAGRIVQPNLGLHMISTRFGTRINLQPVEYRDKAIKLPARSDTARHRFSLTMAGGIKQYSPYEPNMYLLFVLSPDYCLRVGHVFGLGAGADLCYDNAAKPYMLECENKKAAFKELFHSTVHATGCLYIGKLSFLVQPGIYLYTRLENYHRNPMYKLGFRYYLKEHISASIMLKAHWLAKADFMEFGLGYNFWSKK